MTEKTFIDSDTIYLDDGLFNIPVGSEINDMYADLNYLAEENLFKTDEFEIKNSIINAIEKIKSFVIGNDSIFTFDENTFTINNKEIFVHKDILDKTKAKYIGPKDKYHEYLLCVFLRYESFGSGANQFVVDLNYKDQLKKLGFNFELFASTLNHYFDNYCSMFYDLEKYFGSSGSMMCLKIISGMYMANPPYDNNLLIKMYEKIKIALNNSKSVTIIMSIPKWKNYDLEKTIDKDHLYIERKLKYEMFMNPLTKKMVLIPPYLSYLFANDKPNSQLIKTFSDFNNYNLEFPARNKIYDMKYKKIIFDKLIKLDLPEIISNKKAIYGNIKLNQVDYLYMGEYHYLLIKSEYYKYFMLSDLFNDSCRKMCSFGNDISPNDYFNKNKYVMIEKMLNEGKQLNPISIREQIYLNINECSTHNPLLIKFFIKKFGARKVLDPSSGWGDRLIGALTSDIDLYVGIDPNSCLVDGYKEMIKLFKHKGEYKMIESPFETADLGKQTFDLVYTSPPYFDYEDYTKQATQSMSNYKTEDMWLNNFLLFSLRKCIDVLIMGGHIVLYISQEKGKSYVEKMMAWMKEQPEIYYLGNYFKCNDKLDKKLHPIFIFEKNNIIPKQLYDPELVIQNINHDGKKLNVIRDDLIVGGTKSRSIVPYLKNLLEKNIDEIVYTGASTGYGQLALAYGLYLLKSDIKVRIYYQPIKLPDVDKIQKLVKHYYPNTKYIEINKKMSDIWKLMEQYLNENPNSIEIPFGLDNDEFKKFMSEALKVQLKGLDIDNLWLVGGSGTIFNVLFDLLPNTNFRIVQVGKEVKLSDKQKSRTTLYVSSYKFYENIPDNIPYPSVQSYDAKIWEFKSKFQDNDFIWNVAGIHNKL